MTINWFPGHMHKTRKEIKKTINEIDVIIEVLDARLPFSSANPLIPDLRMDKPFLKLLNKSDLADNNITSLWKQYMEKENNVHVVLTSLHKPATIKSIINTAEKMVTRNLSSKPLQAMILGIPNVGKSTIINVLANKIIAKTGNTPAVTKQKQRIKLSNNVTLFDTPGFLWPKLNPEFCAYRLAASGAIKDSVIDIEDVAYYIASYFLRYYPKELQQRFNIEQIPDNNIELMDIIAKTRNCLLKGSITNIHKTSEILLHEFRSGRLGSISLETPKMIQQIS